MIIGIPVSHAKSTLFTFWKEMVMFVWLQIESEDTIEDKENQPNGGEPPSPATTPVPNDKVDYAGLRSLSNLGIDVSFLDAFGEYHLQPSRHNALALCWSNVGPTS